MTEVDIKEYLCLVLEESRDWHHTQDAARVVDLYVHGLPVPAGLKELLDAALMELRT